MAEGSQWRQGGSGNWKLKVVAGGEVGGGLGSAESAGEWTREGTSSPYAVLKGTTRLGRTTSRSSGAHRSSGGITSSCLRPPGHNNLVAGSAVHSKRTQVGAHWRGRGLGSLVQPRRASPELQGTKPDKDGLSFLARMVSLRILEAHSRRLGY